METVEITVKLPTDMVESFLALVSELKAYKKTKDYTTAEVASLTGEERGYSQPTGEESSDSLNSEEKVDSIPSSVSEVEDYVIEKGLHIIPEKFYSYYQKRGWLDGKGERIQDWKKIADSWNQREWNQTRKVVKKSAQHKVIDDGDWTLRKLTEIEKENKEKENVSDPVP